MPQTFRYCPRCATELTSRIVDHKPRPGCPACNYIHFNDPKVGVGVFVTQDSKILLVRRTMRPHIGKWSVPAGFLDHGDDPKATAEREALEETGLQVKVTDLIDVYFNPPTPEGGASLFILYKAELLGGVLQAGDDADAAGFFAMDDLPDIAFTSTRHAIELLRKL